MSRGQRSWLVDAEPARLHLATLLGAGWSGRAVAGTAGVSPQVVSRIRLGKPLVEPHVAEAILGVDANSLPNIASSQTSEPFVPRVGSVRRIQALLALGWTHSDLQARSGIRTKCLLSQQGRWVTRTTHDRVADVFEQLSMKPGPSPHTRGWAMKLGYALPLQWDDIDLDAEPVVPREQPHPRVAGERRERSAVIEDLEFLAANQVGATEAAGRVGMSPTTLDKYLRRGGPDDVALLNRLLRQDLLPVVASKKQWGGRAA